MQPGRLLVVDRYADKTVQSINGQRLTLQSLGFKREISGRRKGKWSCTFPRGVIGHAIMLEYKSKLQELGMKFHSEFLYKRYSECTMFCTTDQHLGHTQECISKRRGK